MRRFLSYGLKDNTSLAFGVLTGILRISKENLFSGLNNLTVNTILDEKYNKYFGFTEQEVKEMAAYYGMDEKMPEICRWYDGYLFGDSPIFNPWSVTNYLNNNCIPRAYWTNTSDNAIIKEIVGQADADIADTLISLLQDKPTEALINIESVYPQLKDDISFTLSFLLLAGYLTTTGQAEETETGTKVSLCLPNAEVRRAYKTEIIAWIKSQLPLNAMSEIERALLNGQPELL